MGGVGHGPVDRGGPVLHRWKAFIASLAPYDVHASRRVGAWILALFAATLLIGTLAVPVPTILVVSIGCLLPIVLSSGAVLLLRVRSAVGPLLLLFSLAGVGMITALNLVTHDASAGAQVALCAPVMLAGSQLRPVGALITLAAAVGAEAICVLTLEQLHSAITDLAYVSSTLITITLLLVAASRRQHRLVVRLQEQAAVDPLTGLVTRRVLDDATAVALSSASSHEGTAMLLIDVDHFKTVNDTHGHPVGDDALTHVARILRPTFARDAVISRIGGDEFAVLLAGCDLATATAQAVELTRAVRDQPLQLPTSELRLSVSVGIGFASRNGLDLRQLYAAADASLYRAKQTGRGRVGAPSSEPDPAAVPAPRLPERLGRRDVLEPPIA
jgi:diguanylate cyclase (GGDEF)-like protein